MSNDAGRPHDGTSLRGAFHRKIAIGLAAFAMANVGAQAHSADAPEFNAIPDSVATRVAGPLRPMVLGTVALPIRGNSASSRWSKIMNASLNQDALFRLTFGARMLQQREQAAFVHSAVNHAVGSGLDSHDCSDDGYWAAASETLGRGLGDCFDIAVAKMEALRLLGFQSDHLYLTTGYFNTGPGSGRVRESAALLVQIDDTFWLLSEHFDQVVEVSGSPVNDVGFTPVLTYGVGKTWVHGKLAKTIAVGGQGDDRGDLRRSAQSSSSF